MRAGLNKVDVWAVAAPAQDSDKLDFTNINSMPVKQSTAHMRRLRQHVLNSRHGKHGCETGKNNSMDIKYVGFMQLSASAHMVVSSSA